MAAAFAASLGSLGSLGSFGNLTTLSTNETQAQGSRYKYGRPRVCCNAEPTNSSTKLETLAVGDIISGTVVFAGGSEKSSWLDVGVVHQTSPTQPSPKPIIARLPPAPVGPYPRKRQTMSVRVRKVQLASARLQVESLRPASSNLRSQDFPPATIPIEELTTGQERRDGVVMAVYKFGALVDVDVYRLGKKGKQRRTPGLLKRVHFADNWASSMDLYTKDTSTLTVSVGQRVDVYVMSAHPESGRFFLSAYPMTAEQVEEEKAAAKRETAKQSRRRKRTTLRVGQERFGTIKKAAEFGVFVDIGASRDALIHVGQLVDAYKFEWKEKMAPGTRVKVMVQEASAKRIDVDLIGTEEDIATAEEEAANNPTSAALTRASPMQEWRTGATQRAKGPADAVEETVLKDTPLFEVEELDDDEFSEYLDI